MLKQILRRRNEKQSSSIFEEFVIYYCTMIVSAGVYIMNLWGGVVRSVLPGFLQFQWTRTSPKQLEDINHKILDSLDCVDEKRYIEVNGQRIWSVTCGSQKSGTPILMVHGMGGGVGLWSMNLEALSVNRPVYAFDLLGFGCSSRPKFSSDEKTAEEQFVESIEGYRKEMGLKKFILLGHSLGGYLSAAYALRYPERVKHLMLVDPWGMSSLPSDSEGNRRQIPLHIRIILSIVKKFNPLSIVRFLGPFGPGLVKKYRPGLAETFGSKLGDASLLHDYIYHCNAQTPSGEVGFKSLSWNVGWAKEPMIERMAHLEPTMPVTFIFGAKSWVDRNSGWTFKNSHTGYVDVQILRDAGHHVYADRWSLFNTLVESIASSVDQDQLPDLDKKTVSRIHSAPSTQNFAPVNPNDFDFQRPIGHGDENFEDERETKGS